MLHQPIDGSSGFLFGGRSMFKSLRNLLAAFAVMLSLMASPAMAKNVIADLDGIANLLRSKGNKVEIKGTGTERYIWVANPDAYTYSIDVMSCDEGTQKNCKSVQFHSGFTAEKPVTIDGLHQYTRDHRFGRAFLDSEGQPAIQYDINLAEGGISEALFLDNVELWSVMIEIFGDFVFGKE
jgi:Putative bacterial sensory transduction regulator